jgi:hypothetical protein
VEEDAYRLPTEDMLPFERHDWYCFHCHAGGEVNRDIAQGANPPPPSTPGKSGRYIRTVLRVEGCRTSPGSIVVGLQRTVIHLSRVIVAFHLSLSFLLSLVSELPVLAFFQSLFYCLVCRCPVSNLGHAALLCRCELICALNLRSVKRDVRYPEQEKFASFKIHAANSVHLAIDAGGL